MTRAPASGRQDAGRLDLRDLLNPAGLLTLSRIPLALAFPFFAADPGPALAIYAAAVISDILDGVVARRTGTTSHTGAMVEGFLDKVFHVNAAWSLALLDIVPDWYGLCWFVREMVMLAMVPWLWGRFIRHEVAIYRSAAVGKVASWLVGIALCACILRLETIGLWATLGAGCTGLMAAAYYLLREVRDQRQQGLSEAPEPTLDGPESPR